MLRTVLTTFCCTLAQMLLVLKQMCWKASLALRGSGLSQWQSSAPSVLGPDHLCSFQRAGGCVCFRRHKSTKRWGPSFYPCLDPSFERTQAWPSQCPPPALCLPGWLVWQPASSAACTRLSSRKSLLTRQQIGLECTWWLSPTSPHCSPNQSKTIPVSPSFWYKLPGCSGFNRVAEAIVG